MAGKNVALPKTRRLDEALRPTHSIPSVAAIVPNEVPNAKKTTVGMTDDDAFRRLYDLTHRQILLDRPTKTTIEMQPDGETARRSPVDRPTKSTIEKKPDDKAAKLDPIDEPIKSPMKLRSHMKSARHSRTKSDKIVSGVTNELIYRQFTYRDIPSEEVTKFDSRESVREGHGRQISGIKPSNVEQTADGDKRFLLRVTPGASILVPNSKKSHPHQRNSNPISGKGTDSLKHLVGSLGAPESPKRKHGINNRLFADGLTLPSGNLPRYGNFDMKLVPQRTLNIAPPSTSNLVRQRTLNFAPMNSLNIATMNGYNLTPQRPPTLDFVSMRNLYESPQKMSLMTQQRLGEHTKRWQRNRFRHKKLPNETDEYQREFGNDL